MYLIALKMLFGNKIKLLMLLVGLALPVILIAQQGGMFFGLTNLFVANITSTNAPIWIMDPAIRYMDEDVPLLSHELTRIKSFPGIEWAAPILEVPTKVQLSNGKTQSAYLFGVDSESLIGLPSTIVSGDPEALRGEQTVFVDKVGLSKLTGVKVGDTVEINDRSVRIAGVVDIPQGFAASLIVYTTYERALSLVPYQRKQLSYIIAKSRSNVNEKALVKTISQKTGLKALTEQQFKDLTIDYYIKETSMPMIFGVAILLGIIVGAVISAQTFYTFVLENIKFLATFKALGTKNRVLIGMLLIQSIVVATISYFIGMGIVALGALLLSSNALDFYVPVPLMLLAFIAVFSTSILASLISVYRVVRLEPGIVFRG